MNNDDPFAYQWPTGSLPPTATIPSGRVEIVGSKLAGNSAGEGGAAVNNVSNGTVTIIGQRGRRQPGPDDPRPGADHRPARSRADRVHPRARACTSPAPARSSTQGEFDGHRHDPRRRLDSSRATTRPPTAPASTTRATARSRSSTRRSRTTPPRRDGGGVYTQRRQGDDRRHHDRATTSPTRTAAPSTASGATQRRRPAQQDHDHRLEVPRGTRRWAVGRRHPQRRRRRDGRHRRGGRGQPGDGGRRRRPRRSATARASLMTRGHLHRQLRLRRGRRPLHRAASARQIVRDSTFSGNSAGVPGLEGNDAGGGGVYTEGGPVEIAGTHDPREHRHRRGRRPQHRQPRPGRRARHARGAQLDADGRRRRREQRRQGDLRARDGRATTRPCWTAAASTTRRAASSRCSTRRCARTGRRTAAASRTPPTARS